MYSEVPSLSDHAGFTRTISATSGRRHLRMSLIVVTTLAIAIVASVAALGIDDAELQASLHRQAAAWNILRGAPADVPAGG
jgi:hypothetical protein